MASNVDLLTQSYKVVKAKKRTRLGQANAVVFDEDARREFLTGFHKRKLAKKEESKKRAQAREKEERLEARREQRRILAEQAAENAARVEEAYGGFAQHQESWTGIALPPSSAVATDLEREMDQREREYSDEEQLATVTVVEDFDPTIPLYYSTTTPDAEQQQRPPPPPPPLLPPPSVSREKASRNNGGLVTKNVKKVRYETKAARKVTRATQSARRTEKAERAGGKAARKKAGGGKKLRGRKK